MACNHQKYKKQPQPLSKETFSMSLKTTPEIVVKIWLSSFLQPKTREKLPPLPRYHYIILYFVYITSYNIICRKNLMNQRPDTVRLLFGVENSHIIITPTGVHEKCIVIKLNIIMIIVSWERGTSRYKLDLYVPRVCLKYCLSVFSGCTSK